MCSANTKGGNCISATMRNRRTYALLVIGTFAGLLAFDLLPPRRAGGYYSETEPGGSGDAGTTVATALAMNGGPTIADILNDGKNISTSIYGQHEHEHHHHHNHTPHTNIHYDHHFHMHNESSHDEYQYYSQSSVHVDKPLLLPTSMALLRQSLSFESYYAHYPILNNPDRRRQQVREFSTGDCSCLNPRSDSGKCCTRTLKRTHKMGSVMSNHLFDEYVPVITKIWDPDSETYNMMIEPPRIDYRDVLLLRNIYDALVSGFLYHSMGKGCDTSPTKQDGRWYLRSWERYVKYELINPPVNNRTMCQYMAEEPIVVGMRAYMDFVFHYHYKGILHHWGIAQGIPEVKERTITVCYEDLMSPDRDTQTVQKMLNFWYNSNNATYEGTAPGHLNYSGSHSTSHDPAVREQLIAAVKLVDQQFYNGEIAWANSVLPC